MKQANLILIVLTLALVSACASQSSTTDTDTAAAPVVRSAPAKDNVRKQAVAEKVDGEIVGKPAAGSKFARLKIGMTLKQVEKLIGPPTKQWNHPTAKMGIPFYFGPDRWVIEYSYKKEGLLTLNSGEEQLLTRIAVNKAE